MAKEYIIRDEMIEQTKARIVLGAPKFNTGIEAAIEVATSLPAADVVSGRDFRDCRNELCLQCGQYKTKHLGSCEGCRWDH